MQIVNYSEARQNFKAV